MEYLNEDWVPEFGTIYTWFAMDKFGKIAVMSNNCWGNIPKVLLKLQNTEEKLDLINEYMWEESAVYTDYPPHKNGQTILDLYSYVQYKRLNSRKEVEDEIYEYRGDKSRFGHENFPEFKGYFVFYAVDGECEGMDFPVGYDGETVAGDYFRYLMPTIYATIDDFPDDLKKLIVVSDVIDFEVDRLIPNDSIDQFFPRLYSL